MACYSLLLMVSFVTAPRILAGYGLSPTRDSDRVATSRARDRSAFADAHPPTISISIEPAAPAPYANADSPVVFPGYLLPDDGCEEPAHAGS